MAIHQHAPRSPGARGGPYSPDARRRAADPAANRLGWQWTVGTGTGRPYGFSRWQVQKRAPELCQGCALRDRCPIQDWPSEQRGGSVEADPLLRCDPDPGRTGGATAPERDGDAEPQAVWLTAESLGDEDPALRAHPDLPAVFVFDAPLLAKWRLSGKRLVFLAETLAEIGGERELEVLRGAPAEALRGRRLATTFAPVPGFRARARAVRPVVTHPWPWLTRPHGGPIGSFSAWRKGVRIGA